MPCIVLEVRSMAPCSLFSILFIAIFTVRAAEAVVGWLIKSSQPYPLFSLGMCNAGYRSEGEANIGRVVAALILLYRGRMHAACFLNFYLVKHGCAQCLQALYVCKMKTLAGRQFYTFAFALKTYNQVLLQDNESLIDAWANSSVWGQMQF